LLFGIMLTTLIYFCKTEQWPNQFFDFPSFVNLFLVLSFPPVSYTIILPSVIAFVLVLILDVSGCTFGIALIAGILNRDNHTVKGGHWALYATSIGTMIAALFGCSPIIVAIESSAVVAAGGRTGLTAVVVGTLFGFAIFLGPLLGDVPTAATSPVLLLIGVFMMSKVEKINWRNIRIALPSYLTIVMMPFTFSISNGLFFGLGSFFILYVLSGELFYKLGFLAESNDKNFVFTNKNELNVSFDIGKDNLNFNGDKRSISIDGNNTEMNQNNKNKNVGKKDSD